MSCIHTLSKAPLIVTQAGTFVLCRTVVLSAWLSITYCDQTVGWMKMKLGMEVGTAPRRKLADGCVPLAWGTETPCNTISPVPWSTSVPSGIFIHLVVWPQQTWKVLREVGMSHVITWDLKTSTSRIRLRLSDSHSPQILRRSAALHCCCHPTQCVPTAASRSHTN